MYVKFVSSDVENKDKHVLLQGNEWKLNFLLFLTVSGICLLKPN
jgi:hypothetical protein